MLLPRRGLAVAGLALLDHQRVREVAPHAHEDLAVGVEARELGVRGEEGGGGTEARLGAHDAVLDAGLHDVLAPVQVELVDHGVPVAELDVREGAQPAGLAAGVPDREHPDLARAGLVGRGGRHEVEQARGDPRVAPADPRVAGAVTALVGREPDARRGLPGRAPVPARLHVPQIDVAAGLVGGDRVVAVAGDTPVLGVAVEGVAAGGVRDDAAVATLADEVEPGSRRVGARDHVLARPLVEVAVGVREARVLPRGHCGLPISPSLRPARAWSLHAHGARPGRS